MLEGPPKLGLFLLWLSFIMIDNSGQQETELIKGFLVLLAALPFHYLKWASLPWNRLLSNSSGIQKVLPSTWSKASANHWVTVPKWRMFWPSFVDCCRVGITDPGGFLALLLPYLRHREGLACMSLEIRICILKWSGQVRTVSEPQRL